ncbi:MAG TPA: EAL domain-containing protein [Thermoanaerobaculia bacterium]|jgi:EAL domain-containing protein (putative c-di-GMP-specific phosphodiesterase class I)/DNA-binding response OmpR family regulator|nr:EAL domain-containing protein [Thermoanaerobaculia bacterium]
MTDRPVLLIADDDQDVQRLLTLYVRPLDCEVLTARDGEEALAISLSRLPDVVLLDVMMPKRSGWEVCQALKAVQRTSRIAVVLVTARGDVKDRLTGLQLGADDYLVKPFNRDEVVKRIGALLHRKHREPPAGAEAARSSESMLFDRASGLPTVPMVLSRLKEMLIEQSEIGIVYVDIEQFESIEAEYGWAFFDEFLRCAGEAVVAEARVRFPKALVAANLVGGSSFYIFFESHGSDQRQEAAFDLMANDIREKLIEAMRVRFPGMQQGQIGFFVGAARIDYRPQIRLERQVYQGMQTAGDAVRDAEQQRKKQLTRELRDIIRRKRVTTLFQPIVWAQERTVFGYEVLTRGAPNSSFRNSDMLFAFAREANLAWALETVALEAALKRLRSFALSGRKFLLNLEAEMFEESEFRIHEMVSFFSEHRGNFVFELTERAAIEDYAVFRRLLDEFRDKGIEVAIDDAGSGYASLEAIAALAPDYLKITKGLVSTLADEPIKQDLVKMLVDLAGKIGAKTLAEGIETVEEYEWCRDLGVDLLQGYYLAHPQDQPLTGDAEVKASLDADAQRRLISGGAVR